MMRFVDELIADLSLKAAVVTRVNEISAFSKTALTPDVVAVKVGLFESDTRLGQAVQAAGSFALPGDTSRIRHPVRSSIARGLTPGGGPKIGRALAGVERLRCPAGFEHGGRFADRALSSCGVHIFSPVTAFNSGVANTRAAARTAADIANGSDGRVGLDRIGSRQLVGGSLRGRAVQIARNSNIPDLGGANAGKHNSTLTRAISAIRSDKGNSFLIRRDGIALAPNMAATGLAKFRDNPDMVDGTLVVKASDYSMGAKEVPLLFATELKRVAFVLPDGKVVSLSRTRDLTPTERKGLPRAWANKINAESISLVASESGGVFKFDYSGAKAKLKDVRIKPKAGGASRSVPMWVYDNFLKIGAPGLAGRSPWVIVKG